jgi:hypothetical protein
MAEEDLFIQEVSDELKAERLRQWWQRFGSWVAVGCVGLILATIGYQYRINSQREASEATTSILLGSDDILQRKQYDSAAKTLLDFPKDAGTVALLARLKAADALQKSGKEAEAKTHYEAIAATQTQPALANYAQLRLGEFAETKADAPYAALANELQAVTLYQQGKKAEAQTLLTALINSPETPPTTRTRLNELRAALQ